MPELVFFRTLHHRRIRLGHAAGTLVGVDAGPGGGCLPLAIGAPVWRAGRARAWLFWRRRLGAGCRAGRPLHTGGSAGGADPAPVPENQGHSAPCIGHRAGGARRRHHRVRCRVVFRATRLGQVARGSSYHLDRGGEGLSQRADERVVPFGQRLGDPAQRQGDTGRSLGFCQAARLPRHADFEGAWRSWIFGSGAIPDPGTHRVALAGCMHDRHGAELAGAWRTDREIRHPRAEGALSAAPRQRVGGALLFAHRPDIRFGRRHHARRGIRHARQARGKGRGRHPRLVGEALHHAGSAGDAGRPRLPSHRSRKHPRPRRRHRHYGGAGAGQPSRRQHRPASSALGLGISRTARTGATTCSFRWTG